MSDDRDNRQRVSPEEVQDEKEELTEEKGPDPLDFISPTQVVDLPSQGDFYPSGHPLRGVEGVEISSMTAEEEDILNNEDLIKEGVALDRVLDSLLESSQYNVNDFLVGDKDSLLIHARVDAYTREYDVTISCPICGEHSEHEYDILEESEVCHGGLDELEEEKVEKYDMERVEDVKFRMVLPETEVPVVFRLLTGKDANEIAERKRNLEKRNLGKQFKDNIEQMKKYVESAYGHTNVRKVHEFCEKMPARDSRALRNIYNEIRPSHDMITNFVCKSCDYREQREVPIRGTFFWPDRKR